ncbi:MAG: site-specific DNA-methyltransferase [Treponema sp.]|nr:site-specific DNA-methyltransferase [Treponema sp.]
MASLAERESLKGKVQCIYLDPPYGIKFNSNFQWSTTRCQRRQPPSPASRAFRDTWRNGIHSYLSYLRDRLTVARDLLHESGSIFVQIGDENVHRVRALMDEVFGEDNFVSQISYTTTGGFASDTLSRAGDYVLWYAKNKPEIKYHNLVHPKQTPDEDSKSKYDQFETEDGRRVGMTYAKYLNEYDFLHGRIFRIDNIISQGSSDGTTKTFAHKGKIFDCGLNSHWKTNPQLGMIRLAHADRIAISNQSKLGYIRYFNDFPIIQLTNLFPGRGRSLWRSQNQPQGGNQRRRLVHPPQRYFPFL